MQTSKQTKNLRRLLTMVAMVLMTAASSQVFAQNNVGINTITPDASAALDVQSTTQGMLIPRMNATQRGLIATPATGLLVYQTDAPAGFYFYDGAAWSLLGAAGPQGATGPQGAQGSQGDPGAPGATGLLGPQGAAGPQGPQGNSGVPGVPGAQGPQGAQGNPGTPGSNGANGQGVPTGGTTNQVLTKIDGTNYNTQWSSLPTPTPTLPIRYYINVGGIYPNYGNLGGDSFAIGSIQLFAGNGQMGGGTWLPCNGQSISINQYTALFSVIGANYGANSSTMMVLPNLNNGSVPIGSQ